MSGHPGATYPGTRPQGGGYPGQGYPGQAPQGYPGQAPQGYPGQTPQGYPGQAPQGYPGQAPQGYGAPRPGGAAPPQGYPGQAPPQGYGGAAPPQGYGGAAPPQGYGGAAPPRPGPPQHGGAPPPQGYGAPPQQQVNPQVAQWFSAVDQDRSGQIDAKELQKALVNGNWSHFSEEACRMMIEMFDKDRSGQINVAEFGALFQYINQWKGLFEGIDRDRSGFIDTQEFSQALGQMGYRFSQTFVQNLLTKYDKRNPRMTLDNFIVASVQIKRLTDSFRSRDKEMRGSATLTYEDFMGLAMGAHN